VRTLKGVAASAFFEIAPQESDVDDSSLEIRSGFSQIAQLVGESVQLAIASGVLLGRTSRLLTGQFTVTRGCTERSGNRVTVKAYQRISH
jgi:hypothetical protein